MDFYGSLRNRDATSTAYFRGFLGYPGTFYVTDSTNTAPISGLVISDSTLIGGDQTFLQGAIIGPGDITLTLQDWTYFGGRQYDATTYVDGTWMWRWYDATYLHYSIWSKSYDTSQYSLVGYKYRDPIETNVGEYYAPMVVPDSPGHYQARWLYLKDYSGSYAHERVNQFTAVSRGISAMRDYPYPSGYPAYPFSGDFTSTGEPLVVALPQNQSKLPGENAMFTLQINGGLPAPISYQWRRSGTNLADSTKYSGTATNTLTIYDLVMADGAYFDCVVSAQVVSTVAYLFMDPP